MRDEISRPSLKGVVIMEAGEAWRAGKDWASVYDNILAEKDKEIERLKAASSNGRI